MAKDTLLQSSGIHLFGKLLADLTIDSSKTPPSHLERRGANKFLQEQLVATEAQLARIYAFSYEGVFVQLSRPTIFLVHGDGRDPEFPPVKDSVRASRAPTTSDYSGLVAQGGSFSSDMRVWAYDKGDFTLRLDVATGTFEQMLLEMELAGSDGRGISSGVMARSSGVMARSSGVMARTSGVMARRTGDGD
jgi:hypothetical protein